MRELKSSTIDGKIYLFPIPVVTERKYLIYCSSQAEADQIIQAVKSKQMTHPDLISEHFIFLTFHTDKKTKIFVPNPKTYLPNR